jgi:hypothetical protein
MPKLTLIAYAACAVLGSASVLVAAQQPSVKEEPASLRGPRVLEDQTRKAAIRDYLESWQSMRGALQHNQADLLDQDFVGTAREKLAETISQQNKLGIKTNYQDAAHDLQVVFYSPDGLSLELIDNADYEVGVTVHDKPVGTQRVHAKYIVVLTPSEVRWKVRLLQASAE